MTNAGWSFPLAIPHWLGAWAAVLVCSSAPALAGDVHPTDGVAGASDTLPAADWAAIRAAYDGFRHAVVATEEGHRARNRGQLFGARFDERGFVVAPDEGGWSFGLELQRYGWGELERSAPERARSVESSGGRLEREWDELLREWYVNDGRGLEHGFTVMQRPVELPDEAQLWLELSLRGELMPLVEAGGRDLRLVDSEGSTRATYAGLVVFDAEGRELDAGFEVLDRSLVLSVVDEGAVYPLTIDPVVQQAYLKASNTGAGDLFGFSVAVDAETIVVGAPNEDSNSTGVNGDGTNDAAPNSGAAYVFVRSGGAWQFEAYLKASNTGAGDNFGFSVSIHGDTIVVGAPNEDSGSAGVNGDQQDESEMDAGAAYVFTRSEGVWSQQAYLKASNPGGGTTGLWEGNQFGFVVDVHGDTIVVSAPMERSGATGVDGDQHDYSAPGAGAAYVFTREGSSWSQQAYLKASNTEAFDFFGRSAAIHGETMAIGAAGEDSSATGVDGDQDDNGTTSAGAVYVFIRSGTSWSQQAYVKASNPGIRNYFGWSVDLSGESLVVGAWGEGSNATGVDGDQHNDDAPNSGAAYVFTRSGTTWSQQAYLKASNTEANDQFGTGVSVSGDLILVGATGEDSNATGIDGDQSNNAASFAGAAYLYSRSGSTWVQSAYIKASNAQASDRFGSFVALSADLAVIGAIGESSNATGVNGNQSNNSAGNSGAAYVFDLAAPGTIRALCFGDESGAPCPCGNSGTSGRGCANSVGPGALLEGAGSASIAASDLVLHGSGLVPRKAGLYFQGSSALADGQGLPYGDGLRCAGSEVLRLQVRIADALGHSSTTVPIAAAGGAQPGVSLLYQLLYRDPGASPCGTGFNTTNALRSVWAP